MAAKIAFGEAVRGSAERGGAPTAGSDAWQGQELSAAATEARIC